MARPEVAPRYATPRDPAYKTFGGKVSKLAASMGLPLMPWQRQVADTALEIDGEGLYRRSLIVLTVPRQSGKTSLLRPVMAHRALTVDKGRVWLTAQLRQDAYDLWSETCDVLEESPLKPMTSRRNSNGSERFTFTNGSTLRPFNAGSKRALHGKQSDLVFIDEAFAFDEEQGDVIMQAVVPTQATRPGAQTWIVSTAGTAASVWLRNYVLAGRAGGNEEMAFFEWGIPEDTEDLTDLTVYAAHHPALGHTIRMKALESAYAKMKPSEFARAYGNFWTSTAEYAIAPAIWSAAATDEEIDRTGPVSIGVEVNADRSGGVIAVCGPGVITGRPIVDVLETRGGIGWIAERVMELAGKYRSLTIVIDPVSPAGTVHRELEERRKRRNRVPLADFGASELVDAHTEFLDALTSKALAQGSHERLDQALTVTKARALRETTVFSRLMDDSGGSPAPLIAAVLAYFGYRHPVDSDAPALYVAHG